MRERLQNIGFTGALNMMALLLMWSSIISSYSYVMASDESEKKYLETAQLLNRTAQLNRSFTQMQAKDQSVGIDDAQANAEKTAAVKKKSLQIFKLVDESNNPLKPSALLQVEKDLYLLAPNCIYKLPDIAGKAQQPGTLSAETLAVPGGKVSGVPVQEFLSFCCFPAHRSLVVLDKSGSLFEFEPQNASWRLLRANRRTLGSPDPHYVSIASDGQHLLLLDPERNQIWRYPASNRMERYFKEVLPWRIRAGDPNVSDGIAIAFEGSTCVLRRSGKISLYPATACGGNGNPRLLNYKAPADIRPSRLAVSSYSPVYIVERENSRVLCIDKSKGSVRQFIFPSSSDLRGLLPGYGGFCVIDGDSLVFRMINESDAAQKVTARHCDPRLSILRIPIKGAGLPRHPGVFPGARRLYRHGVHQGLDFFHDPGAGTNVNVNTPAVAAAAGTIVRADLNYRDMSSAQYEKIMNECARAQYCSEANEDLFRGCQVWIDHGNGLLTRYAHLNKARADLKVGTRVNSGDIIGYIGYSGTGENQPGKIKHPHLHFEIWLDGHYLGYGLTPCETMALYQKVFAAGSKK